ncbi:MAG: UDP-N-acetylmuramoyl-tripeptide--D-alanyl-D-alanine ligase [Symploca sp. SIO3C6]|uniref:UDP-N-acetylmuramoyl-tripeptide--D-alanyl-D-alanine ligase n=1 Tax=Symploca sp. SIO1C4 TaxID=2607765 RepID=A0A6B3N9A0_9CYAN|nr:UDP-N-acetylmuramoyl-tripeptide--D-alanyl-D-alanine ligase [Symploca sp. SIO3C6]NER26664.1 UDP-N-acetylmuramoyl-tripeptide--D-alanyl-D-alanine ligase [Symploca sp. SIO1C4]
MFCNLSVGQLVEIITAEPVNLSAQALCSLLTGITTDTRSLKSGNVFLALRGEKFDGHNFAAAAIAQGAIAVIIERTQASELPGIPQLLVEDTLKAYQQIARWWRDQFSMPVIAVTGSVGKTTTKELIAAVLSTKGNVLKTQANFNNEIGVPKTLLELGAEHDYAVIEMAMRGPGQIAQLTQVARPTIGLITNVGTAHIGILGSVEAIAQAKCELLAQMPENSVAIVNQDDRRLMETAAKVWQGQTFTYGLEAGDFKGQQIGLDKLLVEDVQLPLPLAGSHNALNYLAALAVAKVLAIDLAPLSQGIEVKMPSGRSQRYDLANDIIILDETYNAGLESMIAALELLSQTAGKRHIAVLGTMKELGECSGEFHQQVGKKVEQLHLDALLLMIDDPEAAAIATTVGAVPVECFSSKEALVQYLQGMLQPGDRILFKASHSVGLDQVVAQIHHSISDSSDLV